jgi:hypothetical protein
MGKSQRQKGYRVENLLRRTLAACFPGTYRVPLSGGGSIKGDLIVPFLDKDYVVEVKARAAGFKTIYNWLAGNDALIVKADRQEPVLIVPLKTILEMKAKCEQ